MKKYIFSKNSKRERPRNISKQEYISASYGDVFEYEPVDNPYYIYNFSGSAYNHADYLYLRSLKNTINYYSGQDDIFNYENLLNKPIKLITFSSAHYASGIEKGSIELKYFLSGSLLAEAADYRQDGVIYSGSANNKTNLPVGFVLYREGFVILNNTQSLGNININYSCSYNGNFIDNPRWIHFYNYEDGALVSDLNYSVKSDLQTLSTFVYANKNELNHSNNLSYIKSGSYNYISTPTSFVENEKIEVKGTIPSPFLSGSAQQDKQTFITTIGLYDNNKKLLAVANLANPVRKTENREYIFKLKLDI